MCPYLHHNHHGNDSTEGAVAFWDVANLGSNLVPGISVLETTRFRPPTDDHPGLVQWAPFGNGLVSVGKVKSSSASSSSSSSSVQQSEAARRTSRNDTIHLWSFPLTGKGLRSPEVPRGK